VNERISVVNHLNKIGIDARKTWTPIHMQPCNKELSEFSCENTKKVFDVAFTLPIFNNMKMNDVRSIIMALDEYD